MTSIILYPTIAFALEVLRNVNNTSHFTNLSSFVSSIALSPLAVSIGLNKGNNKPSTISKAVPRPNNVDEIGLVSNIFQFN